MPADKFATNGGQGSFAYADPSVVGNRGQRTTTPQSSGYPVLPGGGGGAKPTPVTKFGGYATGFSPNGIVLVRLFKIV